MHVPATRAVAVTPSDATDLSIYQNHWVYCAVAGNLAVTDRFGNVVTIAVAANALLPLQVYKVMATNTTATGISLLCG